MNRPTLKLACSTALISLLWACTGALKPVPPNAPDLGNRSLGSSKGCQADQMQDGSLVGRSEGEATALLEGCPWRIGERDGQQFPGTMDFNPMRRTLGIAAGKVTWVRRG